MLIFVLILITYYGKRININSHFIMYFIAKCLKPYIAIIPKLIITVHSIIKFIAECQSILDRIAT